MHACMQLVQNGMCNMYAICIRVEAGCYAYNVILPLSVSAEILAIRLLVMCGCIITATWHFACPRAIEFLWVDLATGGTTLL